MQTGVVEYARDAQLDAQEDEMDEADEMERTLIDRIEAAMLADDEDRHDQSERLVAIYEAADATARAAIDDALTCICGWRLATLLAGGGAKVSK